MEGKDFGGQNPQSYLGSYHQSVIKFSSAFSECGLSAGIIIISPFFHNGDTEEY